MKTKTKSKINIDGHYFRQVVENVNVGVYTTDRQRRILTWNKGAEKITGYKAEEVIGQTCAYSLLHHKDKQGNALCPTMLCPLYRSMEKGVPSRNPVYVTTNTKDGKRRWVAVSVAPIWNEAGEVIAGVEVFEDVTKEVEEQEKVRRIQNALLEYNIPADLPVRITHRYIPSEVVGGDFYLIKEQEGKIFFSTADFMGHGLAASFIGAIFKMGMQMALNQTSHYQEVLPYINEQLNQLFHEPYLGTALVGCWDVFSGKITMFSAGNPAPLLFNKATKQYRKIDFPGFPLGEFFQPADPVTFQLKKEEALFLYSDGLTEIRNREDEELGIEPPARLLLENIDQGRENIFDMLVEAADRFNRDIGFPDDITMLLFEYR